MKIERRTLLQLLAASALPAAPPADRRLQHLCELIIPGAVEAGAPQFIELLASENPDYQKQLAGGLQWLDAWCQDRHGKPFIECSDADQKAVLDQIAFRENAGKDARLAPGVAFFAFVRELTLDAYFTSRQGIAYLGYKGNSALAQFPGCPTYTNNV